MESVYLGTYIGQLFKVSLLQCAQGRIRNRGRRCCVLVEGHLGRMRNDGGHEQRPCGRNERDVFVGKLKPGCDAPVCRSPRRAATWWWTSAAARPTPLSSRFPASSIRARCCNHMDEAITNHLQRKNNLLIWERRA